MSSEFKVGDHVILTDDSLTSFAKGSEAVVFEIGKNYGVKLKDQRGKDGTVYDGEYTQHFPAKHLKLTIEDTPLYKALL